MIALADLELTEMQIQYGYSVEQMLALLFEQLGHAIFATIVRRVKVMDSLLKLAELFILAKHRLQYN